jgi:hypothetical protein
VADNGVSCLSTLFVEDDHMIDNSKIEGIVGLQHHTYHLGHRFSIYKWAWVHRIEIVQEKRG